MSNPTRPRTVRFGGCAFVAILALAVILLLYVKSSSWRYRVIGKTDPLTNSHIEYTVSRNFVSSPIPPNRIDPDYFEQHEFDGKPTPILLHWMYRKLRLQSSTWLLKSEDLNSICLYSARNDAIYGALEIDSIRGFIDLFRRTVQVTGARLLHHEQAMHSGLYITRALLQYPPFGSPPTRAEVVMVLINVPNSPVHYEMVGSCGNLDGIDGIEREVNAIADSVRIVPSRPGR